MIEEAAPELEELSQAADAACALLKSLANPDRLLLLCELAQGERNVGQLEQALGIVQPTLSQQLGVLREARLVDTRRDGKHVYYRIASPQALAVMQVLHAQFCPGTAAGEDRP
ncbi:metalloregulator ArsR/SmtB family transcription factor [Ramlibacter sp.]|uniref:ArsR/SmtB family transcription factor n=1 Tax=Ramlibacter sp. TaxID=1917967 RepID=UPI002C130E97|nr:metalloregulator ArsR/SmtB family transcription factor [Ramlibacter sp.]HWI82029.1 metalloregulator ArsR/SmtB family transcription factor [Ramlibacter sp.]